MSAPQNLSSEPPGERAEGRRLRLADPAGAAWFAGFTLVCASLAWELLDGSLRSTGTLTVAALDIGMLVVSLAALAATANFGDRPAPIERIRRWAMRGAVAVGLALLAGIVLGGFEHP